jgi:hypothetical protein
MIRLSTQQTNLLASIVGKHNSASESELDNWLSNLDEDRRDVLIDLLITELVDSGLDENDEPNERGLQIEALIDCFGPRAR